MIDPPRGLTHEDAAAAAWRSAHRRELSALRARRRRRLRWALALPALAGAATLVWAVVTFDPPGQQAVKVAVGLALVLPFLSTFDVLGEGYARRSRPYNYNR